MKNYILKNYAIFLLPGIVIAFIVTAFWPRIPVEKGLRVALFFPLLMLASKGLSAFFPEENFLNRSRGHIIEYAALRGALFGGGMILLNSLVDRQMSTREMAISFAICVVGWAFLQGLVDIGNQKDIRRTGRRPPSAKSTD